ncbi:MAG: DUF3426 domain-containing protein, partial [Woeseiaceae bacterium]
MPRRARPAPIARVAVPKPPAEKAVPELAPDVPEDANDTPPTAISPEQSAALLKTLDQLAGENIRLEDTGVEWRLMDDEDFVDEAADEPEADSRTEELRFDDNTGLPENFDLDTLTSMPAPPPKPEPQAQPAAENPQVDLAFGEPEEWGELLEEVDTSLAAGTPTAMVPQLDDTVLEADIEESPADIEESPPDIDTQFGIQAEAMGIDISSVHEAVDDTHASIPENTGALEFELEQAAKAAEEEDDDDTSIEEDLIAAAFEKEQTVRELALGEAEPKDDEPEVMDERTSVEEPEIDAEAIDTELEELVEEANAESEYEEIKVHMDDEAADAVTSESVVSEQTEEEKSVNMQIDQELLAMAVEDEEGFASTIVIDDTKPIDAELEALDAKLARADALALQADTRAASAPFDEQDPAVESIIMEGDAVSDSQEQQKNPDLVPSFVAAAKRTMRGKPTSDDTADESPARSYGKIAAAVVLALILILQLVHQSRTALATVPAINDAISPIYRALGSPITPLWDVSGWRFEKSTGSTRPLDVPGEQVDEGADEEDPLSGIMAEKETLTIYSRVGNKSDAALPYPPISVSLLDRFDEPVGNVIVEPGNYLTGEPDPRVLVAAGNTFIAVITIELPPAEAEGFKLNVCYRHRADT